MEKTIEKRLKREAEKRGWKCFKFVSPGNDGMPDRILLKNPGQTRFVETKAKHGVLSPIQKIRHRDFLEIGHRVEVIWDDETLNNFLHDL